MMKVNRLEERIKEMFAAENIDFKQLNEEFPKLAEYFKDTKPGKINCYEKGVISVVIEGLNKEVPSTFGYLPVGNFKFNTGANQETMHFLFGNLVWGVEGEEATNPKQYDKLIIPAGKDLIINVRHPSFYVCDYSKK